MDELWRKSWKNPRDKILGTDSTKGLFFKGFAFLFSNGAYGTIARSLEISFASRVVKDATRRPRQLMDEPRPCSSMLSIQGSWMWDG